MTSARDDLRTTSEELRAATKQLHEIEVEKLRLDPTDPRVAALAADAAHLADDIKAGADVEELLIAEIAEEATSRSSAATTD